MISFIKRRKIAILIAIVLVIIAVFALRAGNGNGGEAVAVTRGEIVRTVELAGKVIPAQDADLSFEVGGTVVRAYKKVGDEVAAGEVIAELDKTATNADLLKAEADLLAARAELAKLEGGMALQAKVTNSKTSVVQDIIDAYTDADDAIYNKVDQFFEEPRTPNPEIYFAFDDYVLRNRINAKRVDIGGMLSSWKSRTTDLTAGTYTNEDLEMAKLAMREISLFLDDVARAVNAFKPSTSVTQTQIDKYRTDVASARQNVNTAAASLISGEESFTATVSDVPVQAARVAAAEATAASYRSKLSKMTLRSPLSGIVSKQDAKTGEAISANTNIASVISADYKIEAYVPEVSLAGVVIGAQASVTLDAYGDDVLFEAIVGHVDPRETVRDGVSTYKIELSFSKSDSRIRSGMTSNITIETDRKGNVVMIPSRAITTRDGEKYVMVRIGEEEAVERKVETGMADTKGNVEVVSGVREGDMVLVNPVK